MVALVYLLLCLIWGSTWMAIKIGLADAPPLYAAGIRFLLSILILYSIVYAKRFQLPRTPKEFVRLGYPGIFMFGGSYALVYFGELYVNSAMMAVLFASFPLFVALLGTQVLKTDKLHVAGWLGLAIGFLGIVVISYDSLQASNDAFLGTILGLAGSAAAAYGILIHRRDFGTENVFVAIAVQMTIGGVPLLLGALIFENWSDLQISAASIGSILYLSILGSVVAFAGYYWLLKRISTIQVSLIAFITPIVAIVIGVVFFSESLAPQVFVGAAMILSGIALVNRKKK